jgi:hypothetical protein
VKLLLRAAEVLAPYVLHIYKHLVAVLQEPLLVTVKLPQIALLLVIKGPLVVLGVAYLLELCLIFLVLLKLGTELLHMAKFFLCLMSLGVTGGVEV